MNSLVYIDSHDNTDPAWNLALEEYVLRHMPVDKEYLLVYRNRPSVIVGRNQNIAEEVDERYAGQNGIEIYRRLSGGGAVYHDLQNLNFSFITDYSPERFQNFAWFNAPVIAFLNALGVQAGMNHRSDIVVGDRKISGNAQFSSRGRMFSHGTLLFDSTLETVQRVLRSPHTDIESRSHKSVRANVANIADYLCGWMDIEEFRNRLIASLAGPSNRMELSHSDLTRIEALRKERYASRDWTRGRSPRFRVCRQGRPGGLAVEMDLQVYRGAIESLSLTLLTESHAEPTLQEQLNLAARKLTGIRHETDELQAHMPQTLSKDLRSDLARLIMLG